MKYIEDPSIFDLFDSRLVCVHKDLFTTQLYGGEAAIMIAAPLCGVRLNVRYRPESRRSVVAF